MFVLTKILHALFSCYLRLQIRRFASLTTIKETFSNTVQCALLVVVKFCIQY